MNVYKFLDTIRSLGIFQSAGGLGSLGDGTKNLAINTRISSVSEKEANSLFIYAGMLQRIIELYPDLAALLDIEITSTADIDEVAIIERIDQLQLQELFVDATKSARLFKEAYLVLDVNDGLDYTLPLDISRARGINDIYFLEFGALKPIWNSNRTARTAYEFNVNASDKNTNVDIENKTIIHESRVLLFYGKKLTPKQQALNGGYHASMIDSVVPAYSTLELSHNNAANIFSRLLTFLFKMRGLNKHQDAGHAQMIADRISIAKQTLGSLGGILLDEETESIEPMTVTLTGIPDTLNAINKYFTAQTPLSHDQLWNEGSHSTASDLEDRNTISAVKAFIRTNWRKNWNTVTSIVAKEFTSEKITIGFKVPSFDLTLQEEITLRQTQAAVDKTYIELGVLSKEIVQGNRFMQNSLQTNLNVKSSVDVEEEEQEEQEIVGNKQETKTKDTKELQDASYESEQDYTINSADIKELFNEVKAEAPLLFELLNADEDTEQE